MRERNANHIIPSYTHPPVGCRSLGDRYGSLGNCNPQICLLFICIIIVLNPVMIEHFNRVLFYKSEPANMQHTYQSSINTKTIVNCNLF